MKRAPALQLTLARNRVHCPATPTRRHRLRVDYRSKRIWFVYMTCERCGLTAGLFSPEDRALLRTVVSRNTIP